MSTLTLGNFNRLLVHVKLDNMVASCNGWVLVKRDQSRWVWFETSVLKSKWLHLQYLLLWRDQGVEVVAVVSVAGDGVGALQPFNKFYRLFYKNNLN